MRCILISMISDTRVPATPPTNDDLPVHPGTSAIALPTSLKGTVQITAPGGQTVQAKFE